MVSSKAERQSSPAYALERVRELARKEKVRYESGRVQLDVANLGYALDEVCACIEALRGDDFRHAERHGPDALWLDVYGLDWRSSGGQTDDLYIKLRLANSCLVVGLHSFHRNR
jgi:hypothetical protein